MKGILFAKFTWLHRNPWTFIAMTTLTIVFALVIGGSNLDKEIIPAYSELEDSDFIQNNLEQNDVFEWEYMSRAEMEDTIKRGNSEFGIVLTESDYEIVAAVDSPYVAIAKDILDSAYVKDAKYAELSSDDGIKKRKLDEELSRNPIFSIAEEVENQRFYDNHLYPLFGMALFLVIYTIAYSVFQILIEKKSGIWDRMILSPARKWEMYTANFIYSTIIGYLQISVIFLLFRFVFGFDFGGHFGMMLVAIIPYVLTIVSLIILIVGMVKSVQQFNVIIPIVTISMGMLGGAFWPLEIVDSSFMLALSHVIPIKYGLTLLNGVASFGYTWSDMLEPTAILLLMSVLFTGIGIHLMEKRFVS